MASPEAKTLYFVAPIYARGEHVIGENAKNKDGSPKMIRIARGEEREIDGDVAGDIIIAKQAVDIHHANAKQIAEAKAFVTERNRLENPIKKAA